MTSRRIPNTFAPVQELATRREIPECLYIVVDNVVFTTIENGSRSMVTPATGDLRAKLDFTCEYLTQGNLRTHLMHSNCSTVSTRFISVFENEETALEKPPFRTSDPIHETTTPQATKLVIETSNLQPAWLDTSSGKIPVWLQHGDLPMIPKGVLYMEAGAISAFKASLWICLDEIREIFGLGPNEGDQGEWLACGFIPRSMVAAQVVLRDYQERPHFAHVVMEEAGVLGRKGSRGSIRSISEEEQEEHVRIQILRNKASREDLRRVRATAETFSRTREQPLLRQAVKNRQRAEREDKEREMTKISSVTQLSHVEPGQEATGDDEATSSTGGPAESSRYASIRSPKLRQALQERETLSSNEFLRKEKTALCKVVGKRRGSSLLVAPAADNGHEMASKEPSARQDAAVTARLRELSLRRDSDNNQQRRARAGMKKVELYALGHNPGLISDANTYTGSVYKEGAGIVLDYTLGIVTSVLDEIRQRRVEPATTEAPTQGRHHATSADTASATDEGSPAVDEVLDYEADVSDNQSSASERTSRRRTMRRSPHSRLTTPLSMYDPRPRMPTIG